MTAILSQPWCVDFWWWTNDHANTHGSWCSGWHFRYICMIYFIINSQFEKWQGEIFDSVPNHQRWVQNESYFCQSRWPTSGCCQYLQNEGVAFMAVAVIDSYSTTAFAQHWSSHILPGHFVMPWRLFGAARSHCLDQYWLISCSQVSWTSLSVLSMTRVTLPTPVTSWIFHQTYGWCLQAKVIKHTILQRARWLHQR